MTRHRLRELGIEIGSFETGMHNAITDVDGVRVGHETLIHPTDPLESGPGTVRTGVTAIWPVDDNVFLHRVVGGSFVLNGAGEMSGLTQVREWGVIESPIMLTNTHAVGVVSRGTVQYMLETFPELADVEEVMIPLVGECDDSYLNNILARSIDKSDVYTALSEADDGTVEEGNVGGGTGMTSFELKGGIGTASRRVPEGESEFVLGILVMNNCGRLEHLRIDGVPVGRVLERRQEYDAPDEGGRSLIVVVGTDAPLSTHQLDRICKRAALGIGRVGSYAAHGSGEIVVAFSTANDVPRLERPETFDLQLLTERWLDPLYRATIECLEEAMLNSLCMAEPMRGVDDHYAHALPLDETVELVRRHRPVEPEE
jgi:D-aminopeptidase